VLRFNLVSLFLLASCGGQAPRGDDATIVPPADVTLQMGAHRDVGGVVITFVRVKEDSRCPSDVQCVWAGNAAVELTLTPGGSAPVSRVINSGIDPKTIDDFGLRLTFRSLSPSPRQASPDTSKPTVVLHVEKP